MSNQILYSEKYYDDVYEYRHVILPNEIAKILPRNKLLSETEWRSLGVQQSRGWIHYAIHNPEPHILLFRREYQKENSSSNSNSEKVSSKSGGLSENQNDEIIIE
eukprot:TRINITY_DN4707_c0_g1_i2.p2 TRINITY_DN4707_c0_g1~~TRINITY_DN4707_c0_g1_i2.p2  ORF type:complete len:105 (+),score=32.67 TRINITY_DN4707_c0_g1_i2:226-540(+)